LTKGRVYDIILFASLLKGKETKREKRWKSRAKEGKTNLEN